MRPTGGLVSRTEELKHRLLVYSCVSASVKGHVCACGGTPPVLVLREFSPTLGFLFGFGNKVFLIGLELVDWIRLVHQQAPEVCKFLPLQC